VLGQQPPPIRQIAALEHVTSDSLALQSVTAALAMPGGRVMINDTRGRRALLLDSTLQHAKIVADTTDATADAYGRSWATLIRLRADSALLMVPSTLSMFIISPSGAIARTMAFPRPDDAQELSGVWGVPSVDDRGRLIYFGGVGVLPGVMMLTRGIQLVDHGQPTAVAQQLALHGGGFRVGITRADSSFIARIDLRTRATDTVAWVRIPRYERNVKVDDDGALTAIATTPDPLPLIDQWTALRDGTVAIVRGRDYHVDRISPDGRVTPSAKLPFEWKRVGDTEKQALIDSAVTALQHEFDEIAASRAAGRPGAGRGAAGSTGGRGGGAGGGAGGGSSTLAPMIAARPELGDVPDYFPPFGERAVTADADDNLWIRTTNMVDGRPVYDVVSRGGTLIDRVQLPRYRTVAGFGAGVVYMAVADANGVVRLERARVK
jgi:hypothetical protein